MAQAPNRGLRFELEGKKIVFGTLDNGDTEVVVLAIEKGVGANDYSWQVQMDIDYLVHRFEGDIDAAMVEVLEKANNVLESMFGKVTTPVTNMEKFQAYIMNSVEYDPATNTLKKV